LVALAAGRALAVLLTCLRLARALAGEVALIAAPEALAFERSLGVAGFTATLELAAAAAAAAAAAVATVAAAVAAAAAAAAAAAFSAAFTATFAERTKRLSVIVRLLRRSA